MRSRHRYTSKFMYLLVLPVFFCLFLISSCGIPTYLQSMLIDSDLNWQRDTTDPEELKWRLVLTGSGLNEIQSKVDEIDPGIKLFYTISDSSDKILNYNNQSLNIETYFNKYMKGERGNGLDWRAASSAPGFYLYRKSGSTITLSLDRPALKENDEALLMVGTFAMTDNSDIFQFNEIPSNMDVPFPKTTGTVEFSLSNRNDGTLQLNITGDATDYRLKGYNMSEFPTSVDKRYYYDADDEPFHSYLNDIPGMLYIHIWASLFGGRGDFSNTYWSELKYVGALALYGVD
ncbi:MAG: hypothetical protein PHH80_03250 [Sphaerochaetaceae bacterium]|nr:hypothetical protein [Sphaerochaetaceae bacterium]